MDDEFKKLGFKDFVNVDYTGTGDEYLALQAKKRHRGVVGEDVEEALSHSQRRKAGQRMKRMSRRIQMAKKRALKKAPTMDKLKDRANKQARRDMVKKLTRGQSKSDLSIGRRSEIEKRLKKAQGKIDRNAKRLLPQMRKLDRERRSSANNQGDKK